MVSMRFPSLFVLWLASMSALAQDAFLPSQEDIRRAMEQAREAVAKSSSQKSVKEFTATQSTLSQNAPLNAIKQSVPNVNAIPKPGVTSPDIAALAQKYKDAGKAFQASDADKTDLLVFVSFSMPRETLQRLVEQTERAGGTLVFRGLKGDSMMKMSEEIQRIVGKHQVNVAIHPPAFQQFGVDRVPVVVLARGEASNVLDNGCAKANTFVKVSGDVTIDYALDYIERMSVTWASEAHKFKSKLVGRL